MSGGPGVQCPRCGNWMPVTINRTVTLVGHYEERHPRVGLALRMREVLQSRHIR